ncbi:MAG: hypothetical protein ABSB69_15245 [Solirubrobacteraceae bacterium]
MLRTAAACFALPAIAVIVAGCGNSSGASTSSTRTSITRAQVVAYARNVNLRAADAPGMTAQSAEREVNVAAQEAELGRCIGIPTRRRDVVRIASPSLRRQAFGAISSVAADLNGPANPASVAAEDTRDLAAAASKHGVACQERYFQREYTRPGVSRVEVASLPNPISGIYGGVGSRFRVTVAGMHVGEVKAGAPKTRKPISVVVYADVFLLAVGSAGIELEAGGIAKPFPQETERRLVSLLYRRAEAHKL